QINMDISIAFRASSGRHSLILPALSEGRDSPVSGEHPLPCKQPNQSTRERRNLQPSFSEIIGPSLLTFLCLCDFASLREILLKRSRGFLTQRRKDAKKSVWIPTPDSTVRNDSIRGANLT